LVRPDRDIGHRWSRITGGVDGSTREILGGLNALRFSKPYKRNHNMPFLHVSREVVPSNWKNAKYKTTLQVETLRPLFIHDNDRSKFTQKLLEHSHDESIEQGNAKLSWERITVSLSEAHEEWLTGKYNCIVSESFHIQCLEWTELCGVYEDGKETWWQSLCFAKAMPVWASLHPLDFTLPAVEIELLHEDIVLPYILVLEKGKVHVALSTS